MIQSTSQFSKRILTTERNSTKKTTTKEEVNFLRNILARSKKPKPVTLLENPKPQSLLFQVLNSHVKSTLTNESKEEDENEENNNHLEKIKKTNKINIYVGEYDTYANKSPSNVEKVRIFNGKLCSTYLLSINHKKQKYELNKGPQVDVKKLIKRDGGIFIPNDYKGMQNKILKGYKSTDDLNQKSPRTTRSKLSVPKKMKSTLIKLNKFSDLINLDKVSLGKYSYSLKNFNNTYVNNQNNISTSTEYPNFNYGRIKSPTHKTVKTTLATSNYSTYKSFRCTSALSNKVNARTDWNANATDPATTQNLNTYNSNTPFGKAVCVTGRNDTINKQYNKEKNRCTSPQSNQLPTSHHKNSRFMSPFENYTRNSEKIITSSDSYNNLKDFDKKYGFLTAKPKSNRKIHINVNFLKNNEFYFHN